MRSFDREGLGIAPFLLFNIGWISIQNLTYLIVCVYIHKFLYKQNCCF